MCESQPLQDTREQQQHISTRNDIDKRRDREREMANLIEQHAVNVGFHVPVISYGITEKHAVNAEFNVPVL